MLLHKMKGDWGISTNFYWAQNIPQVFISSYLFAFSQFSPSIFVLISMSRKQQSKHTHT